MTLPKTCLVRAPWLTGIALAALLAGCTSVPRQQVDAESAGQVGSPWLALAPSALGCAAAVQQRLTVQPPGQSAKELDALLEVDAGSMRLAILNLGQMVGTLDWNGTKLDPQLSRWWPAVLKPEQVLSDVQLAFWPEAEISRALPAQWTLVATPNERVLKYAGAQRVKVRYLDANALEVVYQQGNWSLRIDTPGGADLCSNKAGQ
ncbi:DUF3261 domain-containing protein [Diaphorobacter sp. HDW4A]|uniref:DUF3261 domain-containing protein n=1 Tax=Diaphorobacter sp. HDW4A TaxID=2714924 RepID=UPI001407E2B9|nr:DUF3261 domain-containing protein [Diaphorobacter sp. HDW4A]QIL80961.1 DUF3261 domain-containing protein [Diaphorobacter sp. HDW4A]